MAEQPRRRTALVSRGADQRDGTVHGLAALKADPDPVNQPAELWRAKHPPHPLLVADARIAHHRQRRTLPARWPSPRPGRTRSAGPAHGPWIIIGPSPRHIKPHPPPAAPGGVGRASPGSRPPPLPALDPSPPL